MQWLPEAIVAGHAVAPVPSAPFAGATMLVHEASVTPQRLSPTSV
jgi:hypothetical protein